MAMGAVCSPFSGLVVFLLLLFAIPLITWVLLLPPHRRIIGEKYTVPAGPRGSPFLGSLSPWFEARREGSLILWLQKQAQYGEMTTLSMGTKTWVLLNHERVLNEIIAKRASITHERPYFPVASGLVSKDHRLFLQQTEQWREGRRLLHRLMTGEGSKFYSTFAESASLGLLRAYLDEPDAWYAHNYRYPLAIMYRVVTGTTLQKTRGELEDLQKVTSAFLTCINSSLVDFFPQVGVLPRCLQLWRRRWEAMGEFHYDVFRRWWSGMKGADIPESSFFREVMLGEYTGSEDQAMYITLFIITAGSDNPRMTMNAFLMVCIAQPEFIQRMRLELDNVCGADADRLPNLDDLVRAPYSSAVVKEVLRWRPTVPLIPQRVLAQDLEFEGYRFPRGTEFLVNAVSVSTCGFDEADKFKPERWLGDGKDEYQGDTMPDVSVRQDLWQFALSAGRRSCVGYKLAQKELFIAFSRLVYCFDFSPAGAFDDKELNAFAPGEPFPVKATIRSPAHERLIRRETARCDVWGV